MERALLVAAQRKQSGWKGVGKAGDLSRFGTRGAVWDVACWARSRPTLVEVAVACCNTNGGFKHT